MNKKNLHLEVSLQGDSYQLSHRERETLALTFKLRDWLLCMNQQVMLYQTTNSRQLGRSCNA